MAGTPREHVKDKGFWNGGAAGHGNNRESSGRASGYPGRRAPNRTGVKTDMEELTPGPEAEGPKS